MTDDLLALWPWAFALIPAYLAIAWVFPEILRPVCWLLVHVLYRVHVYHGDRVPRTGPVLIVANHVTYLDWILVGLAAPRHVRFVIWAGFYKNPIMRFVLSFGRHRVIALDSTRGRPRATTDALQKVVDTLDSGRVVCVFAEGSLTRNGQMRPFGRGIEWILKRVKQPVPVVPAHLDNLWGTFLSWERGRLFRKWPKSFRRRIAVYFGHALPSTATAAQVRAAVQECDADCGIAQSEYVVPVHTAFVRNAATWRNLRRVVFVDFATGSERTLTWPRALVGAWGLAGWLKPRLGPGPNVGVWLPTGMGSALANLALTFLGKTTVNLNYTAGADSVRSSIQQAGVTTIVTAKRFLDKIPLDKPGVTVLHLEEALGGISGREKLLKLLAIVLLPAWLLERLIGVHRTQPDDLLTILFSSGSTGDPKGVMLSYRNISANVDGLARGVEFTRDDRMLCTLPFFHTFGLTACLWTPITVGMKAVFYPDPRAAKEVGELSKKYACTIMLGTATFLRFYLRRCHPDDFQAQRLIICGAEKLPVKLAQEFRDKFGVLPLEGYGCTELSPVVGTNLHDVTVGGTAQVANKFGTIGQPIPGVAVKTFDPESFEPLPHGAEGLLGAKGPNVMVGYLHQPEKTQQVIRDGWYVTGDVGFVHDDGFIQITGRVSRFAKVAGEMVPLERLDDEMHDVLATGGDRVLAVAAVPDDKRGERVVVLLLPTVADRMAGVFDELRKRGLPNLWVPDVRDCFPVESFPVLGSGKLDLKRIGEVAREIAEAKG